MKTLAKYFGLTVGL